MLSDSKTELAHNLINRKQNIGLGSAISLYYQTDEIGSNGSQQLHSFNLVATFHWHTNSSRERHWHPSLFKVPC